MSYTPGLLPDREGALRAYLQQELENAASTMNGLGSGFREYTPVWTAATTPPVLNNGTLRGGYVRVNQTVQGYIRLVAGSTTTFGTGAWQLTLPFQMQDGFGAPMVVGYGAVWDNNAALLYPGVCFMNPSVSPQKMTLVMGNAVGSVDVNTPITWAQDDSVDLRFSYEAKF